MSSNSPVTEIANLPIKAGVDINDKNNHGYQTWQDILATIAQQEGYQRAYYGFEIEDPTMLQLVVDWDNHESHLKFIAKPLYGPFMTKLITLLSAPAELHHFEPKPFPPLLLGTEPCIEMATFFGTEPRFVANVEKFGEELQESNTEGYLGHVFGPVLEDIEKMEGDGKGKAVMLCIGWQSKDVHMKFRESEAFKSSIHYLRDGMKGVEMHHTVFKTY